MKGKYYEQYKMPKNRYFGPPFFGLFRICGAIANNL
jgi:hypothetical protein